MGLWDKVKGAVQSVTGGAADVRIEVGEATLGEDISVSITATAKADLKIDKVYLLVRAYEEAEVRDVDHDGVERVHNSHETFNDRIDVAGAHELANGQSHTWEVTFTIPTSANPTFDGHMISHTWQVQAGLDTFGNDPDSGWKNFEVWDN
jgi:hypothetical protein